MLLLKASDPVFSDSSFAEAFLYPYYLLPKGIMVFYPGDETLGQAWRDKLCRPMQAVIPLPR